MRFVEGEEVLARQPNAAGYSKGKITSIWADKYKIQFNDGLECFVYENDIKTERVSRTTARMSMRIARKSPVRSPSRKSPSRRSPARKSPSRRSPGRSPGRSSTASSRKLPVRSTKFAKVSLPRIEIPNDKNNVNRNIISMQDVAPDDSPTDLMPLQSRLKEIGMATRRSTRLLSNVLRTESEQKTFIVPRNIERAVSLPVERKNQLRDVDGKERGFSVQRDQDLKSSQFGDDVQPESKLSEKRKIEMKLINEPQEWGGWIGTFILIFLLPASIILPQFVHNFTLNKAHQNATLVDTLISTNVKEYINLDAFLGYLGFLTVLAVFSGMPIGKYVIGQQDKIGILKYRINGLLSAILIFIAYSICEYNHIPVSKFILDNSVQLSISGWILGAVLALILYIKASRGPVAYLNIHASTNSIIYNFWQGKEVNPRFGFLDFKIILWRASIIGTAIINVAILTTAKNNMANISINNLNSAVFIISCLQLLYCFDILLFEANIVTSFEVMYEGTGYMTCTAHLLYPFLSTLLTRFVLREKTQLDYASGIFIVLFFIGYLIYRRSNSRKSKFRTNPSSPSMICIESIPTPRGKRLMTSGLWGHVRHPNYLGDIIMQWSLSCISLSTDLLPYYAALCCTVVLMYRAMRDNARCKMRYGNAWDQYCSQVKHMIVKHVF